MKTLQLRTRISMAIALLGPCLAHAEEPHRLWTGDNPVPATADLTFPEGLTHHAVAPSTPESESGGRVWRKGADVIWHEGVLHYSYGRNDKVDDQGENSPGESCAWLTSEDGGKTWSELGFIARGDDVGGISHGVFHSHEGELWSFNGAFTGKIGKVRALAFLLDEQSGTWQPKGEIVGGGFWPLQKPMKLPDGNWILSGARVGDGHPAAVAISHGDDFTKWDLVVIPQAENIGKMWGESALIRDGDRLINIARYGSDYVALVATSDDGGRTWKPSTPSDLPMTTSKPYAGRLSTGQPYLINTIAADATRARNPLTIAVGEPEAGSFSRIFQLDDVGSMMYPGAWEHDGKLYVSYTRSFATQLAVVPVASLAVDAAGTTRIEPKPATEREWELDSPLAAEVIVHGEARRIEGVQGHGLQVDGRSTLELNDSAHLNSGEAGFTASVWFNPFTLEAGQQMLMAKNRYSLDERQWGLTIEPNGRLRAHLRQGGWRTISCEEPLQAGRWHCATLVVSTDQATLFLNGKPSGGVALEEPLPATRAPITLGGIWDAGKVRQAFFGALDEFRYEPRAVPSEEIAGLYRPVDATLPIPEPPARFPLWDESVELPVADELPELEDVEFHVIKKWDKPADGYTFLHGVALAWHKGKLFASIGHNKGAENTVTEEAQFRVSEDGGKTWGPLQVIDAGEEEDLAVSHGVFHSHEDSLWAFQGGYYGKMKNIHTRAYRLDDETGEWEKLGVVVEDGFWAINQPVRMDDGNWIMPGGSFGLYSNDSVFPAAVAISQGDDFTKWDFVKIEADEGIRRMWGESSLFVDGSKVTNIARYGGGAQALVAVSEDYGRTWTSSAISNLPMATSKPAAGILSTGQRYLVCTTAKNNGGRRSPLTIAVSRPGENQFSQVFVIRRSQNPDHPGESADRLSLSYPYATEHEGKLYVGYSNNGGRKGNLNSAELAVIPIAALAVE